MLYAQFTARQLEQTFGIKFQAEKLFQNIEMIAPTAWLLEAIQRAMDIGFGSEKSRSERLVSPVLSELSVLNQNTFTIYSGLNLDVDEVTGLKGECDFILSFSAIKDFIKAPIFNIVEAKKNDIEGGTIQCAAQLIAAQRFNLDDNPDFNKAIYGCSTTGVEWRFLKLEKNILTIGLDRFYINEVKKLLGVLQHIINISR